MMPRAQRNPDPAPQAIPSCERVLRSWDPEYHRWAARLMPGETYVTQHDEFITAVVGACIAVCIRDPLVRVGGVNLFMLPMAASRVTVEAAPEALELARRELSRMIDELINLGASRTRLKAKAFGGDRQGSACGQAGAASATFVRQFLREEGLPLVAEKVGDSLPRRVVYSPASGMALVQRLPARYAAGVASRELQYCNRLACAPV